MKKLKLGKVETVGYDIEYTTKPVLFIKGLGRKCPVCSRHIVGKSNKTTCSDKCTKRIGYIKNKDKWNNDNTNSIKSRVSIKKIEGSFEFRILSLYLKKGLVHRIKITPEYVELWNILEKIQKFRDIPLVLTQ
jgi:hypothetical protein